MDRIHDSPTMREAASPLQGEIYWVEPDETRGSIPALSHPHVVVQDDALNRSRIGTVVVCALTSNLNRSTEPGNVLLNPGEGGLDLQSVVVVSQLSSLYKWRLRGRIGSLSPQRFEQVYAGIRFQQAAHFR